MTFYSMPHFAIKNLPKNLVRSLLLAGLITALTSSALRAADNPRPWMLEFPEISGDSLHVYFLNNDWVGYYSSERGLMYTVPRDTLEIPPAYRASDSTFVGDLMYSAHGNVLVRTKPNGKTSKFKLPKPRRDNLKYLTRQLGDVERRIKASEEIIHPVSSYDDRVWFGLELSDTANCVHCGGLGWFDTRHKKFQRVYAQDLEGYVPTWIGAAADTVNILYVSPDGDAPSRMKRLAIRTESMTELDLQRIGLGDESVQAAAVWGDTLLFTTNTSVVIWRPNSPVEQWNTRQYASRSPIPLYLLTFNGSTLQDSSRMLTLGPGKPTAVTMWLDDWVELLMPDGIRGYVDDAAWRMNQDRWSSLNWGCSDLCFARVRVPRGDSFAEGDILNAPITYVGKDKYGMLIEFHAAWAKHADLLPVLMPR
jgi:hypothetical protein